ncbi:heterokaryon incompatibility protein-domain-containing protein [Dactylonectria macrodidyma]|uniref:Heterokaryon incompatibility protein-domain-containing protein n=1 Tax=Dactylonectria macrodidyma TaxID=307937 RepID=A0A9P9FA78_9HYPO|nr:heterokaryon incompatibility protein-domain-containing protein [Dactylonectria macrodidyma]
MMGLKNYHRAGQFAYARAEGATAATFKYPPEDWDAIVSAIRQWASTKSLSSTHQKEPGRLYQPMHDPFEIRVLELQPGTDDDKLRGTLHHCTVEFDQRIEVEGGSYRTRWALSMKDLNTMICYTALSYCWGPQVFDASIECDGHEKNITKSLEAALRQLRQPDASIVMWIDQLCINQEDEKEKEQQIPLMGRIYSQSLSTVIWLGEGSAGSNAAMRLLEELIPRLQFSDSDVGPDMFEGLRLPPPDSEIWKDLSHFLSRPWFTRVWIIQETILPMVEALWVACGNSLIPWEILDYASNILVTCGISRWLADRFASGGTEGDDVCQRLLNMAEMRSNQQTSLNGSSLFSLLVKTRNAQCYDPRDKVYGLLGVCSAEERAAVSVSYAKDCTAPALFRDLTSRCLGSTALRTCWILSFVDHESPDLPSWVPDWRVPSQVIPMGSSWASGVYNACGRFRGKQLLYDVGSRKRGELCVQGVNVDTVVKIGDLFTDPGLTYLDPALNNKTLLACVDFVSQTLQNPPCDTVFDAFWHTVVAGKNENGQLKCPSSFAEIFSLLLDESTGRSPSLPGQTYSVRQKRPKGKGRLELENLSSRLPGQVFEMIRKAMKRALQNRRLGVTKKGYLGLFPQRTRDGDAIYVLDNCPMPFTMRQAQGIGEII